MSSLRVPLRGLLRIPPEASGETVEMVELEGRQGLVNSTFVGPPFSPFNFSLDKSSQIAYL